RGNVRVQCLGVRDEFVSHGKPDILREHLGLTPAGIVAAVQQLLSHEAPRTRPKLALWEIPGG
ncbi:MAG: hypothetical protein H5T99_05130, partial [Moorella sp. (in: Bacteria)]|nr:hypothetical protein [Moorella sp. (in: firmicutes)]